MDAQFADGVDPDKFISDLLEKAPILSSTDSDTVLFDLYETNYGIFNHMDSAKRRPLASVALHESEDNTHTSSLYEAIDGFHTRGIKELFGLNLKEYLELPSDICIKLMETAGKDSAKKASVFASIDTAMNAPKKR